MAKDGFWSLPPGDVSAGCQTNTPHTWTASAEGAVLVPAPHCHGNLLCNETPVHLVTGSYRGTDEWKADKYAFTAPPCTVAPRKTVTAVFYCCTLYSTTTTALSILTNFMLSWVIRNLYGVQLEAIVTLSYVIDPGDVGAHFINHLHKLWNITKHQLQINWIQHTQMLLVCQTLTRW